jgi:hypothetical protein
MITIMCDKDGGRMLRTYVTGWWREWGGGPFTYKICMEGRNIHRLRGRSLGSKE